MAEVKNKNLDWYEKFKVCPPEAQKTIKGGRLSGKTDINPLWRIKTLTEQFGPCGVGWKAPIIAKGIEEGGKGERMVWVDINLYVKVDGEWSEPIYGTGGSKLVEAEKGGLYTNDECFKMAYTDAISVACKMIGMAADIYWDKDTTKYSKPDHSAEIVAEKEGKLTELIKEFNTLKGIVGEEDAFAKLKTTRTQMNNLAKQGTLKDLEGMVKKIKKVQAEL